MDVPGFRQFLKKRGKQTHVIDGLVMQVAQFEAFLVKGAGKELEQASDQDLQDYIAYLDAHKPGAAKKNVRGVAVYYLYSGNQELASLANNLRMEARRLEKIVEY